MPTVSSELPSLLRRSLESGRIHSAYLLSGPGSAPRDAALDFVRALVCQQPDRPCEECIDCRRSSPREPIALDGTGRNGPLLRHVGDHADLFWVERGEGDTRVRIGQVRALQSALHLQSNEGGRRAAVIADAEWMNHEAQNALLRILEEPPPETTLVLATATAAGLLATVRSRCQRVRFESDSGTAHRDPEREAMRERFDGIAETTIPDLLDWAAEYRGARATVVGGVEIFLETASLWMRDHVATAVCETEADVTRDLDAFRTLNDCRKTLSQRNANPQMVVERALLALRGSALR
jgi:DNA polymerase III delta prime subunit